MNVCTRDMVGNLPDSGDRTEFKTGAVRDLSAQKGFPSDIPPCALKRLANHFESGAKKYSRHNWLKGIPLSRYQDAIMRHLTLWAEGDMEEDHAAAVLWNMSCAMHTELEIVLGNLPKDLEDLPYRKKKLSDK